MDLGTIPLLLNVVSCSSDRISQQANRALRNLNQGYTHFLCFIPSFTLYPNYLSLFSSCNFFLILIHLVSIFCNLFVRIVSAGSEEMDLKTAASKLAPESKDSRK